MTEILPSITLLSDSFMIIASASVWKQVQKRTEV